MSIQVYVAVTRARSELIAIEALVKEGFSAFTPMEVRFFSSLTGRAGARRKVATPIFPRVVFVACEGTDDQLLAIRHARRVTALLGWARSRRERCQTRFGEEQRLRPFDVLAWVHGMVWDQLLGGFDHTAKARSRLKVGQKVKVIAGIWQDQVGELRKLDDGTARVMFKGRHMFGELPFDEKDLEPVPVDGA